MTKQEFELIIEDLTEDQMYAMMPLSISYHEWHEFKRKRNGYYITCIWPDEHCGLTDKDIKLVEFYDKPKKLLSRLFNHYHLPNYPKS